MLKRLGASGDEPDPLGRCRVRVKDALDQGQGAGAGARNVLSHLRRAPPTPRGRPRAARCTIPFSGASLGNSISKFRQSSRSLGSMKELVTPCISSVGLREAAFSLATSYRLVP